MKKNVVRIVAALLVAMLALTLIPMGAFAANEVIVSKGYYDVKNPTMDDYWNWNGVGEYYYYSAGDIIKVKDYNNPLIVYDNNGVGTMYDFAGFEDNEAIDKLWNTVNYQDKDLPFINKDIQIPKDLPQNMLPNYYSMTEEELNEWYETWNVIYASYVPHSHRLSRWYSDGTTHWRECLVCKKYDGFHEKFMYQNWCQDGDEDGICNVCGGDVPYHDITVIEDKGGKITVNRDNASHRMKITADVEAAEGYKLKKLHFVKVRDDGSKQEITRHKLNGQFWTRMPTYELEVSAEFVKTK